LIDLAAVACLGLVASYKRVFQLLFQAAAFKVYFAFCS